MNNFVVPKTPSILYREKDWKPTPNPKLKKGQVNAPNKCGPKTYPQLIPASLSGRR
jgi:hypothetical protein